MAENDDPYHFRQQSRRDRSRITSQTQNSSLETHFQIEGCAGIFLPYDPSLLTPDLVTCAGGALHHYSNPNLDPGCALKGHEAAHVTNFMGYLGGIVNASSSSSAPVNGGDRTFDQPFNGGGHSEIIVFQPEPLSLSLSSHHTRNRNLPTEIIPHRSGGYELAPAVVDGVRGAGVSAASRWSVPLGPFTGYASVLKGSKFLKPAQQLLEELCNAGRGIYAHKIDDEDSSLLLDPSVDNLAASCGIADGGGENWGKKSKLISMLDEVYKRYKQYYQQLEAVIASFECVAGLGNAAPYASFVLKALSQHFRCLKNAIMDQLQLTNKGHGITPERVEGQRFGSNGRRSLYNNSHRPGFSEHNPPVWRPQRGLPEHAVTVLRAWLFDHFLHPYPTDTDKLMLSKQTGLSRNQVSNWFINARVRLWKPMVEEIHMLETRQAEAGSQRNDPSIPNYLSNDNFSENTSTSTQRVHDLPSKKTQTELPNSNFLWGGHDTLNYSYGSDLQANYGSSMPALSGGGNGVSLTLGLPQNNRIGLPEPFPMNAAQRFGLGGEGCVMGGFEGQSRQFGRDVIGGGQFLHDFVG